MDRQAKLEFQTTRHRTSLARNYDRAVWFYESSAKVYSANQISRSKRYQLRHLKPGDKTLFLGVGSGEDALMAAQHGAVVTCVDISEGMLDAVQRRLKRRGFSADLICGNALDLSDVNQYDACCTNYFLNMFQEPDMVKMMRQAVRLIRPGGKLMIADVAIPQGNVAYRLFNTCYCKFAMAGFYVLGLVPWHKDYDYHAYFAEVGVGELATEYFRLFPKGPVVYQSIVAQKH